MNHTKTESDSRVFAEADASADWRTEYRLLDADLPDGVAE